MQENKKLTDLSELGEFGLIDHLTKNTKIHNDSTIVGIGDDAAVIGQYEKEILVSTDLLMEGVHFDMQYTPLKHLGYKAVAVNLSDIAAMNGRPTQILVSLAVSSRYSVEALEELYEGIHLACQRYHVDLVGGDTTSSKTGLAISITAIGEAKKSDITYRNGAKKHDLLCVSGDLGAAYTGLLILEREKATFQANPNFQPDLSTFSYVLERFLKPDPRLDIVSLLKEKEIIPTSMIDISDGLASEILHICKDSDVGCEVYEEKIPISHQTSIAFSDFKKLPVSAALNGGEDYELLFTIRQEDYEKVKDLKEISIIGHITDADRGCQLVTPQGSTIELKAQGWNHMRD